MPTIIYDKTWSGGSGLGDKQIFIGYCKEEPVEVLQKVYKTHYIHYYKDLYRPVDYSFPNNCSGLVIKEVAWEQLARIGIKELLSVDALDIKAALGKTLSRGREVFAGAIESARDWHIKKSAYQVKNEMYEKLTKQLDEVASVTLKMQ